MDRSSTAAQWFHTLNYDNVSSEAAPLTFFSSASALQAQRFVAIVLLPHVRRDIRDNKRLHFALFQSLKKACYKPDAFYKVNLPLGLKDPGSIYAA